jgi:hypothetical protein
MTAKTPQTKLGAALRTLAKKQEDAGLNVNSSRCQIAAAALDRAALTLGARGARVKTLGAYYQAQGVYRQVAGQPYED